MYAQATYKANVSGSPISGPFTAIPGNTVARASFTGFGAVYEPGAATEKIRLEKYVTANLNALSTLVGSSNTTLADGDILKITYNATTGALVVLKNASSLITATDTGLIAYSCSGLIGVGTSTDSQDWTNFVCGLT